MLVRKNEETAPINSKPAQTRALMMPRTPRSTMFTYSQLFDELCSAAITAATPANARAKYKSDGMRAAKGGPNELSVGRYVISKPGGRDGRAMWIKRNAADNPWKGRDNRRPPRSVFIRRQSSRESIAFPCRLYPRRPAHACVA